MESTSISPACGFSKSDFQTEIQLLANFTIEIFLSSSYQSFLHFCGKSLPEVPGFEPFLLTDSFQGRCYPAQE